MHDQISTDNSQLFSEKYIRFDFLIVYCKILGEGATYVLYLSLSIINFPTAIILCHRVDIRERNTIAVVRLHYNNACVEHMAKS